MTEGAVRVRVAPSPTGDPHVGTAYQALFNYAFARRHGGRFVLRVEDTDQARSSRHFEEAIFAALRWLGLDWDEGPGVGGDFGPYRQSERLVLYRRAVEELLEGGFAYRCFCTRQRLEAMRAENRDQKHFSGYDRLCRSVDSADSSRRADGGEPYVVRLRAPIEGTAVWRDLLRGEIEREWALIDDQVLLKSDGFPTYHLACVVDDHQMEISHVIRGEEWINSVPKHLLLYRAFGWELPVFCHLPLLRNPDKTKSKLSKRRNPTSIEYYRRAGFLPEALVNFLGIMAWSGREDEKFRLEEMVQHFALEEISLGGPVFDVDKLRWLNGRYIREDLDAPGLRRALQSWALNDERLERIAPLAQPRLQTLADWGYLTAPFFADEVPLDPAELELAGKSADEVKELFQLVIWHLERPEGGSAAALETLLRSLAERFDVKLRQLTVPFYVAVSGSKVATPLFQSMEILGSDVVRMRLRRAIAALGGLSSKRLKALEKRRAELLG